MSAPFTKDDWLKAWETRALDAEERLKRAEEFIRSVVEYDEYHDDHESSDKILGRIESKARDYFRELLAEREAKDGG